MKRFNQTEIKEFGIDYLPDGVQFFIVCTARICPIRNEFSDSLHVLSVAGCESRALVDDKITIIVWLNLAVDI